jgi:hypothetical protein
MNRTLTGIAGIVVASSLFASAGNAIAASAGNGQPPSVVTTLMNMLVGNPLAPDTTGQPNQSCANFPSTPGNSASAPGSAFNPTGKAGTVYAGQQPQNSKNPKSVSQYDVACSKQPVK